MPIGPHDDHAPQVGAPLPQDEADRLAALHSYGVLDTGPEARFDALTRLAAQLTDMPVALVSLVDEHRQWFKSHHGTELSSTPRDQSFCAHALLQPDELLVVPDTARDARFARNPLVTEVGLRAYAGAPLVGSDGQALGTLCVLDTEPRRLGDRQLEALRVLGDQVVAQLEATRSGRRLAQAEQALRQATGSARPPTTELDGLERALVGGELVVHYQPFWQVEERGRALCARVSGAEALVRWQHPERGLLLPAEFVPAMQGRGLLGRLGEVVLRDALRTVVGWRDAGLLPEGFRMHVNVAAQQLHDPAFPALVDALLAETGVEPASLCLEVTESALLDAEAFDRDAAQALVARGLSLALDDFGTGFSSLTQLRGYPFACVKVDRSFVVGSVTSQEDRVIVDTVVSMAAGLGLAPVAEGVETPAQLDAVLQAGCSTVQGWLFGKASDAAHWRDEVLPGGEQVLLRATRPAGVPAPRAYDGGISVPAAHEAPAAGSRPLPH